jgi:hypothetical protein
MRLTQTDKFGYLQQILESSKGCDFITKEVQQLKEGNLIVHLF